MEKDLFIYKDGEEILAIVVKNGFSKEGIEFFTPDEFSQQLAYMNHKKGKIIRAHLHNPVKREVHFTQEVLFIKRGKLKVNLYSKNKKPVHFFTLEAGDVILLVSGGHGFEVLEDIEMLEVKQGPYAGENDKTYL
jgi:hypothetical protein